MLELKDKMVIITENNPLGQALVDYFTGVDTEVVVATRIDV